MEQLQHYPVTLDQSVVWGDMDAFGHVNNTVYFRYFEDARMAYFERVGIMSGMQSSGKGPILGSTQCRFKAPLEYPDRLTIAARIESMGADRFVMKYLVFSEALGRVAAEGEGVVVFYDYKLSTKCGIPTEVRDAVVALESGSGHALGELE